MLSHSTAHSISSASVSLPPHPPSPLSQPAELFVRRFEGQKFSASGELQCPQVQRSLEQVVKRLVEETVRLRFTRSLQLEHMHQSNEQQAAQQSSQPLQQRS